MVKDIFVDKLILADALHHAVPLLSQSPNDAKHRNPRFRLLASWSLSFILHQRAQRLQDVEDCDDRPCSSDACATVEYNLAGQLFLLHHMLPASAHRRLICYLKLLDVSYQFLDYLVVSLLRSSVVWPAKIIQLRHFSDFPLHCFVEYFKLASD